LTAIKIPLRAAHAGILRWLQHRRDAERAIQAKAEALIQHYGPEDARLAARELKRKARSRRTAAHWRRVARAVARIARERMDGDTGEGMRD